MCLCVMMAEKNNKKSLCYLPRTSYYIPIYIYNCNVVLLLTLWYFHSISIHSFFITFFGQFFHFVLIPDFINCCINFINLFCCGLFHSCLDVLYQKCEENQQEVEDQYFFCYKPQVTIKNTK